MIEGAREEVMKPEIHPQYQDSTITCACGAQYPTRSTRASFSVDVCSACHPFFTGKQRMMDTAGRVERFRKKYENQPTTPAESKKEKKAKKLAKKAESEGAPEA
jgi:large subunit ribosomal protein L31